MPDNNYHHLVYEDLLELEQGYADALLDHFSNGTMPIIGSASVLRT